MGSPTGQAQMDPLYVETDCSILLKMLKWEGLFFRHVNHKSWHIHKTPRYLQTGSTSRSFKNASSQSGEIGGKGAKAWHAETAKMA